jgi:hypothetical protein
MSGDSDRAQCRMALDEGKLVFYRDRTIGFRLRS